MDALDMLRAHGPYMSPADEAVIEARIAADRDVADLALRTCLCGEHLDGFDGYHAHLVEVAMRAAKCDR